MARMDVPTVFGVNRITIRPRTKEDDPQSCINGSLKIVLEGDDRTVEITVHDTQTDQGTYRRDSIELCVVEGIKVTVLEHGAA